MQLNINTDALVKFSVKLEKLHKSALPSAVRGALNKAVFDVKKNTMPHQAAKIFEKRRDNFFTANSKFENASGFNVNSMKATVGMISIGGTNKAVDDLERQEHGGEIDGRSFIPLKQARTGESWTRITKKKYRISEIKNKIIDSSKMPGKNRRMKWNNAALKAGKGGFVIGNEINSKGNKFLYVITDIKQHAVRGGYIFIKAIPLYGVKAGRMIKVDKTSFMKTASLNTNKSMDKFYQAEAERQIAKLTGGHH